MLMGNILCDILWRYRDRKSNLRSTYFSKRIIGRVSLLSEKAICRCQAFVRGLESLVHRRATTDRHIALLARQAEEDPDFAHTSGAKSFVKLPKSNRESR